MSLERIKLLFYTAVIAIAIILDCTGDVVGWITAVVVLAGARPMFRAMRHCFRQQFWRDVENIVSASGEQPARAHPSEQE